MAYSIRGGVEGVRWRLGTQNAADELSLGDFSSWTELDLYAVAERVPRVYPWVNEPYGGTIAMWK